ncbi:hypothetical protein [Bradyrhizobium ivorense]|uniref:hypothetical protein n=1 Tax=Bradyrhizobium ivorense TaxID=2511166 RepID=UPI0010B10D52|nr:hypothetical protein [Bradyrhizobium ivorense]VIO73881.1 hypothetical protein CI41S_39900 [Bradyrhizobium ivorense]
MTTSVLVHNADRAVRVVHEDRVYDHEKKVYTDDWKADGGANIAPGQLYHTYCTETRRVTIVEPPLKSVAHTDGGAND